VRDRVGEGEKGASILPGSPQSGQVNDAIQAAKAFLAAKRKEMKKK